MTMFKDLTAWRRVPIVDLCEAHVDCVNRTAPIVNEPTPFKMIRTTNVKKGFIDTENVRYVTAEIYKRWTRRLVPKRGDVILTREAPLGDVGKIRTDDSIFLGQRLYHFRADSEKLDADFLLYALMGEDLQGQIRGFGSGSTVEHMRLEDIPSLEINLPSLSVQRRIAGVLSVYDELIENNQRRIKILEEIASALYREWFVNFRFPGHEKSRLIDSALGKIPQGWGVKKLDDLINCNRRATTPGSLLAGRRYVPIDCLPSKSLALLEAKPIEEAQSSLQLFERDDILFGAMRPYFHKVVVAPFAGVTRTTCFVFKPTRPEWSAFATMTAFDERTVAYANAHSQGATIPYAVWGGSLAEMPLLFPPDEILIAFQRLTAPILGHMEQAYFVQRNLSQTRDLLLPRLLSGQIDFSEVSKEELLTA